VKVQVQSNITTGSLFRGVTPTLALALGLPGFVFFAGTTAATRKKGSRKRFIIWLGMIAILLMVIGTASCGANGFNGTNQAPGAVGTTPPGLYVIDIYGTFGGKTVSLGAIPLKLQ